MTITSLSFQVFLAAMILIFFICPVKFRWIVLLIGSIFFYVKAGALKFLPFIFFTTFVVWFCARAIGRLYQKQDEELHSGNVDRAAKKAIREKYKKLAKRYLILALVLCIGLLVVTKFTGFAVMYLNRLMKMLQGMEPLSAKWIIVPLGISYYTFSTVGYLLDVYWKRYEHEENPFRFLLYSIYFPHIVQGPISRYNLLGQELKKELRFDLQRVIFGAELMLWGFIKKLVIADRLNIFVSAVFNGQKNHAGSIFLLAMLLDAFQIYTDFSGYTDIVRGVSQIFGVELEKNFNHPFFSRNIPEFWRRWHMTMGGWFKDYVYYPCTISHFMKTINKKSMKSLPERGSRFVAVVIPVFITWSLTGLWHGTGKTYLSWGLYYGTLITLSTFFQTEITWLTEKLKINTECYSWKLFQMLRTFALFVGGRMLVRPGSLRFTLSMGKRMLTDFRTWSLMDGTVFRYGLDWVELVLVLLSILVLLAVDSMQERFSVREALARQNLVFRWILLIGAILAVLLFGVYGEGFSAAAFIYTQY